MRKAVLLPKRTSARRYHMLWIVGGSILAVVMVGGVIILNMNLSPQLTWPPVTAGRVWGQPHAPVSVEVFSDFQCPVCGRADAVLHRLAPQYIDTGRAKVTYRHFAFIGPESQWAAQAADCAGEQQRFWDYAQVLFSHQAGENVGAFARNNLQRFARQLGLETTAFNSCLDSGRYATVVEQDTQEGRSRGVQGTPTFFIHGQRFEGLLSPDQLAALIERKPAHK